MYENTKKHDSMHHIDTNYVLKSLRNGIFTCIKFMLLRATRVSWWSHGRTKWFPKVASMAIEFFVSATSTRGEKTFFVENGIVTYKEH